LLSFHLRLFPTRLVCSVASTLAGSRISIRILSRALFFWFFCAALANGAPQQSGTFVSHFPESPLQSCANSKTASSLLFTPAAMLFSCASANSSSALFDQTHGAPPSTQGSSAGRNDQPKRPTSDHPFWDRENDLLFAAVGASRTLDYFSTLNFRRRGRNEALLTNDVVDNHAAFASIEAAATVASIGVSYLFHRYHHHRLERWTSILHASLSTAGAARNYSLKTAHP